MLCSHVCLSRMRDSVDYNFLIYVKLYSLFYEINLKYKTRSEINMNKDLNITT